MMTHNTLLVLVDWRLVCSDIADAAFYAKAVIAASLKSGKRVWLVCEGQMLACFNQTDICGERHDKGTNFIDQTNRFEIMADILEAKAYFAQPTSNP